MQVLGEFVAQGCKRCLFWAMAWLMTHQMSTWLSLSVCVAVRVNETDTFADEDGANDEYFDFEDVRPPPLLACFAQAPALKPCSEMTKMVHSYGAGQAAVLTVRALAWQVNDI